MIPQEWIGERRKAWHLKEGDFAIVRLRGFLQGLRVWHIDKRLVIFYSAYRSPEIFQISDDGELLDELWQIIPLFHYRCSHAALKEEDEMYGQERRRAMREDMMFHVRQTHGPRPRPIGEPEDPDEPDDDPDEPPDDNEPEPDDVDLKVNRPAGGPSCY